MNRGSTPVSTRSTSKPSSFNEAPIHESGKYVIVQLSMTLQESLQ